MMNSMCVLDVELDMDDVIVEKEANLIKHKFDFAGTLRYSCRRLIQCL